MSDKQRERDHVTSAKRLYRGYAPTSLCSAFLYFSIQARRTLCNNCYLVLSCARIGNTLTAHDQFHPAKRTDVTCITSIEGFHRRHVIACLFGFEGHWVEDRACLWF
ncbi:hypothetical protein HOLleu_21792 [Holothuria leucospilota]|uniref:Uncharacterized protein n=1 Tax=Holothuria leucospilota TaxID=206669 RepID=A0A9Q1BXQ7_HOLLE|nr:hypothetical protein HOLleu_21792 [Holothuria leucospilota]